MLKFSILLAGLLVYGAHTFSQPCTAVSTRFCDTTAVSDRVLGSQLNLTNPLVSTTASLSSQTITTTVSSPKMRVVYRNASSNACQQLDTTRRYYGNVRIVVSKTGNYTFTISNTGSAALWLNVFQNSLDPLNPCATWVGSSASGTGVGSSTVTLALTACTVYWVTLSRFGTDSPFSGTVSFSNSIGGTVYSAFTPSLSSYIFMAVNTATNRVAVLSNSANFTGLPFGTYRVYGVSFVTATPISSFIGKTLAEVQSATCVVISSNSKRVAVANPCLTTYTASGATPNGRYQTSDWIKTNAPSPIPANGQVTFDAGTYILFEPNVTIAPSAGGFFLAKAEGCNNGRYNREIFLNTTGFGFDRWEPNGIAGAYVGQIDSAAYYGYSGVRLCVEWHHWEFSPGVFSTLQLQRAVNYIASKGLKVAIHFFPKRFTSYPFIGDFIAYNDRAKNASGDVEADSGGYKFWIPSLGSASNRAKIAAAGAALSNALYPAYLAGTLAYVSLGLGITEEYYTGHGRDFSPAMLDYYRNFLSSKYNGAAKTPYGLTIATAGFPGNNYAGDSAARDFHRANSKSLVDTFTDFKGMFAGSQIPILLMPADFMENQGNTIQMQGNILKLMAASDGVYHTAVGYNYEHWKNLGPNDLIKTMYPAKVSAIEYDFLDISTATNHNSAVTAPFDLPRFQNSCDDAFARGVNYIHVAMNQTTSRSTELRPVLLYLRDKWVKNQTGVMHSRVGIPYFQWNYAVESYGGDAYMQKWKNKYDPLSGNKMLGVYMFDNY